MTGLATSKSPDANRQKIDIWWLVGLPLAGLVSGLLTVSYDESITRLNPVAGYFFVGAQFGALVWLALWEFWEQSAIRKGAFFAGASGIASLVGHILGMLCGLFFASYPIGGRLEVHSILLFPAGFVGAFVLFSTVLFFLFPTMKAKRVFLKAIPWSAAGGLLAVIAWTLGPSLGRFLWFTLNQWHMAQSGQAVERAQIDLALQFYSLYIVWQIGIAVLLGITCWAQATRSLENPVEGTASHAAV